MFYKVPLNPPSWIHLCATWDSSSGLVQLWVDGQPSVKKLASKGTPIQEKPNIVLDQAQSSYGYMYSRKQMFVGHITDLHVWDRVVVMSEVEQVGRGLVIQLGDVLEWGALGLTITGHVFVENSHHCLSTCRAVHATHRITTLQLSHQPAFHMHFIVKPNICLKDKWRLKFNRSFCKRCGKENDYPRMGRRETGDSGTMTTSERTELGSLQGIASSDDGSGLERSVSADTRMGTVKKNSSQPARTVAPVKKHQHKHNLKHRYDVLETLGKGTYGKVKKAVERGSGKTVAIKSIRKERITDDLDRVHIQREIEIISSLKHPNIIRIHEVFESKDKIVIVMEYASQGELYDYVNERRRLPEAEARNIFRQITSAVHYCHKNGVVHRDLKLENILLDQDFNVKLADFGLSNHFQRGHLLQTYCGSPLYASPEIVKGLPYQGPEVDCWALGVLLYALVYGSMPFDGADYRTLTQQISKAQYRRPKPPSDACALIDWMLTVRVEERATVEDIANHWWVNWGYEEPVCDCQYGQDCPSPLLARYIDWQNRAACDPHSVCPTAADLQYYFSFPLKPAPARPRGTACLRKSRKENVISQPTHSASTTSTTATGITDKRKPKGILKTQSSFDTAFLPAHPPGDGLPQADSALRQGYQEAASFPSSPQNLPVCSQPSSKMPKKGILKKLYEGESGYSSSPERGNAEEHPAGSDGVSDRSKRPSREEGSARAEVVRRRKGILKRNGKFSTSLDLPEEQTSALRFPESLQQLLLSTGGTVSPGQPQGEGPQQGTVPSSRPASVISDDSFLSSDSFDLLDMATQSRRKLFSRRGRRSVCSSEEELEDQGIERQGGKAGWEEEDSLEEGREILRKAQEIAEKL
ncbi:hypothetical protein AGOR_G00138200 [Albula goreensis]|uniref:non-specific serine/threonine protein kinase n=1 Tax=Albula goreensis TaxID=1534307 RepID=A0A8T3D9Y5_9TELE|nr:hypothetical protein AGOR_G00138200 [Albula goreensis]